jgi:phosphoglycerate dehydrogenase-like enzyme
MQKRVLLVRPLNSFLGAEEALGRAAEIVRWSGKSENDLLETVKDVHGIIASNFEVTKKLIQRAPLLEVIGTPQAGFDKIDVEAATKAIVCVVANTGLAPEPVAEFTLGLMIALARRIARADRDLRKTKDWKARGPYADPHLEMGVDLRGSTIGIVGFGHIGSTVARLCRAAFSCRVLAYDPYVTREQMAASDVEKADDFLTLAQEVNFLLLHVALTKDTYHLINEDVLRRMRKDAFLVNCARGPVVDERVLIRALKEGWISGAALDVFEEEPIQHDHPFLAMDNVILTPHIAGVTIESAKKRGFELVRRILSVLEGERPEGLVNPEVWPHFLKRFRIDE